LTPQEAKTGEEQGHWLLEKMMAFGRKRCELHDDPVTGESCCVETLGWRWIRSFWGFKGVTKEILEGWIGELPEEVRVMVEYLLAAAKGSPLPRP
jgi:hypothetical protein